MDSDNNQSGLLKSINELKKVSSLSNSSDFLRSFTLNSSIDVLPGTKRKLLDDSDTDGSAVKARIGSPLMSPWEIRRIRTDLVEAKAQVVRLEDRIDQLHKKNKEDVIFFDQEKSEMKVRLDANRKTIKSLERKLERIRAREAEARADLAEALETKLYAENDSLQKDSELVIMKMENDRLKYSDEKDEAIMELKTELRTVKEDLKRSQLDVEEHREMVESLNARLAVASEDYQDLENARLELNFAKDTIEEMERDKKSCKDKYAIMTGLCDRAHRLEEIESELSAKRTEIENLKMAVNNQVLMEERINDLELKLKFSNGREAELIALKEKIFDLETEAAKWAVVVNNRCSGSREKLLQYFAEQDEKEVAFTLHRSELRAEKDAALKELKNAKNSLEIAVEAENKLQEKISHLVTETSLLRRRLVLVARERDSYREQLDLYEKDLTVSGSSARPGHDRIKEMEAIVKGYSTHIFSLEQKLSEYFSDDIEERIEEIKRLNEEIKILKEENSTLMKRKDEVEVLLEEKVARGEHLSPGTVVLHLKNNPYAQAETQISKSADQLRLECERLKARVRLLESGDHLDLTTRAAVAVDSGNYARVQELEEELKSANLKNTRLKEVFKKTSGDFRDVSYMLLGYRIDLVSNKTYRLSNMYSDNPSDHFMFQQNKFGMMEMLETPFLETLSELVNEHLHEKNSIPCFLSAVTLSLHECAGSAASDEDRGEEPIEIESSD